MPASALFLSFAFYGFIGWAYESTLCALLNHGFFSNSGFLLGPCCPIYGVGALACWLGLRGIESVPAQFVSAALVCCAIEYVAGWWLERTTRARFWDYSDFPLNIKGRVCLYGVLVFGTGAVLVCHVIQPSVLHALSLAPGWLVVAAAVLIGLVMAIDAVFALASWKRLSSQLETVRSELADRINESLKETSDSMLGRVPDSALDSAEVVHERGREINCWLSDISDAVLDTLRERVELPSFIADGANSLRMVAERLAGGAPRRPRQAPKLTLNRRELRFFNAFPHLRMFSYEGIIRATRLKDRARDLFRRRK
ncbi:protein of unknown function DUF1113 [Coriobacterium glomerans PW2]|uniref:ABC transporter permease n=1 Tax=Coriobacterium glomerans (strain ATCC 49209 / DSM 20642 / JCM 10262 / PW2) TaxID=700015 RepID=F2N742_CORGP|nr:putative ABC transporter permease [Coriobacterium glomerans]AEB06381.1 protein of unknown function DUF1113 [Coriobacterium glomerans PW2]